jgi:hypothetical protein
MQCTPEAYSDCETKPTKNNDVWVNYSLGVLTARPGLCLCDGTAAYISARPPARCLGSWSRLCCPFLAYLNPAPFFTQTTRVDWKNPLQTAQYASAVPHSLQLAESPWIKGRSGTTFITPAQPVLKHVYSEGTPAAWRFLSGLGTRKVRVGVTGLSSSKSRENTPRERRVFSPKYITYSLWNTYHLPLKQTAPMPSRKRGHCVVGRLRATSLNDFRGQPLFPQPMLVAFPLNHPSHHRRQQKGA